MVGKVVGWEPKEYVHGNYFQKEVSEAFYKNLNFMPSGSILDIGSGDGEYSHIWADRIHYGKILGIDSSPNMVKHANQRWARDNLSFEVHNIEEFQPAGAFDTVMSFWCLHWTDVNRSLPNIFEALKPHGRAYAVFSSGSGNSVVETLHVLAEQDHYKLLAERYINAHHQAQNYYYEVATILNQLPFSMLKLKVETTKVLLPNMDYFKNLLLALPFIKQYTEEISPALVEDMVEAFYSLCQRKYGGKLYYETRPIYLEAEK
jgi:trans-aconitate methyltransferase